MEGAGVRALLFTDVEGSTALLARLGPKYTALLTTYHQMVHAAVDAVGGFVVHGEGDDFFAIFETPGDALDAALEMQLGVQAQDWPDGEELRVRAGLHIGDLVDTPAGLVGIAIHHTARLCTAAHGGQVLVSEAARAGIDHLPARTELRPLGVYALRDVGEMALFRLTHPDLLENSAPPRASRGPTNNLPAQRTSMVGRDADTAAARAALDSHRCVTLVGPGGVGKTRLAIRVASELLDRHRDGAWLVELAPLADHDLVAEAVATALGVRGDPGRPMLDTLIDAILDRDLLIILDNCEHVIDAVAKVADALLNSCPRLQLLATSREPLDIDGEHLYRVPSLELPAIDETDLVRLAECESVQLFAARAAQHDRDFALDAMNPATVASVCRRLDGIPLAIELAAARLRSLTLDELDARLDQRFQVLTGGSRTALPRQQTLRALIDWSYDLLTEPAQAVLRPLSVFSGGWTLDAAETVVAGGDTEAWEVLDHLSALVDKSLVQAEATELGTRYRLLESVREYTAAKLEERGDAEVVRIRAQHRHHYLTLAEQAASYLISREQAEWLDLLDVEHANLRAALASSQEDTDIEAGLRVANALRWYWKTRGAYTEGVDALTELLAAAPPEVPPVQLGWALATLGDLRLDLGDDLAGRTHLEEALAIGLACADDRLIAEATNAIAWTILCEGSPEAALPRLEEGLRHSRAVDDRQLHARMLGQRACMLHVLGEPAQALLQFDEALELMREVGDRALIGVTLNNRAVVELDEGELVAARAHANEGIAMARALHDDGSVSYGAYVSGLVDLLEGDHAGAGRMFTESILVARRVGDQRMLFNAIFGIALVATRDDDPDRAARLHGAADTIITRLGYPLDEFEEDLRDADFVILRDALGEAGFDAAFATGQALSRDESIALALESESR